MKKALSLILVLALCLSVCACGSPKTLKEALTEQAADYVKSYAAKELQDKYTQEDVIIRDISKYKEVYTILGTFTYVQDGAPLAASFKLQAEEISTNRFQFEMVAFLTVQP